MKKKNFAIAVSGGADSLCLAYFSKIYASEFKNRIPNTPWDEEKKIDKYFKLVARKMLPENIETKNNKVM